MLRTAGGTKRNLRTVLQDLVRVDFDLDLTGFSSPEIDFRLEADVPGAHVEENGSDIPAVEDTAITMPGTIWKLGPHRVGCGDATDAAFVARVLEGNLAAAAFTDPPRNIPVQGVRARVNTVIVTGEFSDHAVFGFLYNLLSVLKVSCKPSALAFVCIDWRSLTALNVAARRCAMPLHDMCVWTKANGGMGGFYRNAHELIPVYRTGDEASLNNVERGRHGGKRTNVWNYPGVNTIRRHRNTISGSDQAAKPVALVADAFRDVTKRGDVVIDTFLGSGTSLMAAHQTGRICCGTEPDPRYVDLIIRRWQAATGCEAVRADTGEPFNSEAQRLLMKPAGSSNV